MRSPLAVGLLVAPLLVAVACGEGETGGEGLPATPDGSARLDPCGVPVGAVAPPAPPPDPAAGAGCAATIAAHQPLYSPHVTTTKSCSYNSNPPSSGPHCLEWPRWGVHRGVVPRCNWIHGLEHGAVAVLHNCANGCADVTRELGAIARAFREPDVAGPGTLACGATPRIVVTADPELPAGVQIAAAAWGYTFTAPCWGAETREALLRFLSERVGRGPEKECRDGTVGDVER
jgi:hypothetical protein